MAVADHKIYATLLALTFAEQRISPVHPIQSFPSQKPGEQYCQKCGVYRMVLNVEYGAAQGISNGTCAVCGELCHFHTPGTPAISGEVALKRMRARMAAEKKDGLSMETKPSLESPTQTIDQINPSSPPKMPYPHCPYCSYVIVNTTQDKFHCPSCHNAIFVIKSEYYTRKEILEMINKGIL